MIKNNKTSHSLYCKTIHVTDVILKILIYLSAIITISFLTGLILYILINGIPHLSLNFIFSGYSENDELLKGIFPMIINTIYIIILTLLISLPVGIFSAIYLTQYSKQGYFIKIIRFATEILAGIPSIIFGLFGYSIFCVLFGFKTSILSGCLTMSICILPIIIKTSEEALIAVPKSYTEGAIALGSGKLRIIRKIILPCAAPGVLTSVILAIGRIVGESAALIYTSGMSYKFPKNIFSHITSSGRTLTLHLYQLAKQANTENAFSTAFATASVLLILILVLNIIATWLSSKIRNNN